MLSEFLTLVFLLCLSNRLWFDHFHKFDHGHVVAWDGVVSNVGSMTIKFDNNFVHTLREVRQIPLISKNIISMGELKCTCFRVLEMYKGILRAFKATRKNDIYITHVEVIGGLNSTITNTDHTQKWYYSKDVFVKDMVSNIPFYDRCV